MQLLRSHWKTILLSLFLVGYLFLGFTTVLELVGRKPLPDHFIEDFNFYSQAYANARQGGDPYAVRDIGYGFLYPPPALLIVGLYAPIVSLMPRIAALFVTNIVLLVLMIAGVARLYGYPLAKVWWWFPLGVGFAPFLELALLGQINVISSFGVFLMLLLEESAPFWGGVGLALGVITKVTPLAFVGYLLANRKLKAVLGVVAGVAVLCLWAGLKFGWQPFVTYVDVFRNLLKAFPTDPGSQAFFSIVESHFKVDFAYSAALQRGLTIYVLIIFAISAIMTYLTRRHEPLFIIMCLGLILIPNVLWYHHYVFFLLPLFVWMAWRRLHPMVVLWCLVGLAFIQVDRQYSLLQSSHGLLAHAFGHVSILLVLGGQVRRADGLLRRRRLEASGSTDGSPLHGPEEA